MWKTIFDLLCIGCIGAVFVRRWKNDNTSQQLPGIYDQRVEYALVVVWLLVICSKFYFHQFYQSCGESSMIVCIAIFATREQLKEKTRAKLKYTV